MMYENITTGKFGLTIDDVRRAIPNASIPEGTPEVGDFKIYSPSTPPDANWDEEAVELQPIDGVQTWKIVKISDEFRAEMLSNFGETVRNERNQRLSACDWTQLQDTNLTSDKKIAWQRYRQELRDLTSTSGFPMEVKFPDTP